VKVGLSSRVFPYAISNTNTLAVPTSEAGETTWHCMIHIFCTVVTTL